MIESQVIQFLKNSENLTHEDRIAGLKALICSLDNDALLDYATRTAYDLYHRINHINDLGKRTKSAVRAQRMLTMNQMSAHKSEIAKQRKKIKDECQAEHREKLKQLFISKTEWHKRTNTHIARLLQGSDINQNANDGVKYKDTTQLSRLVKGWKSDLTM